MLKVLLIVVQGKPEGKSIPLAGPKFKIGRGEGCHLRPNSDLISREHCEITITDTDATIRDLGSRNGTMLNGRNLTGPAVLKSGDLLQIGPLTFAVAIQGAPVAAGVGAKPGAARPGTPPKSLDDVGHEQIESWLIADNTRPTPDRPSGVYDGDTLTISAYKEKEGMNAAKAAQPPEAETPTDEQEEFERLPEGEGDPEEEEEDEEAVAQMPEELIDESNPFYAAKKAQAAEPAKPSYKDSSDAASDILRKMLDRRRAGRS